MSWNHHGVSNSDADIHLIRVLEEAGAQFDNPDVIGFRISYGFNGLLLRCRV